MITQTKFSVSHISHITIWHAVLTSTNNALIYFPIRLSMAEARRFPVVLQNQGPVFQKTLKDVTGNILRSPTTGQPINMFNAEMRELIEQGKIRIIHKVNPGYVYFTTNLYDETTFQTDRDNGSEFPWTEYAVYFDEDFQEPPKSRMLIYRHRQ